MAKKVRQRISYVLENAKSSAGGHRLGVNGLAVDSYNDILYSAGRDGIVCAWDLNLDRSRAADVSDNASAKPQQPTTRFRSQCQAHVHWINDIILVQDNTALVSASSDLAVKLWRPHSEEDGGRALTIGEHADYVKCVAAPPADMRATWVASAGLDRKICLWDLNGAGKTLEVDVRGDVIVEKGSVYALAVGRNLIASGGPEKIVRLSDPRTSSKVSKLVGHLGNIRSILIDDAGDIILSAGADKTIKMWSVRGGRCMYTFTMHDESVWSLHSDDPRLGIFYSSDRSGLVAKTDIRGGLEDVDNGLSLALAQEHFGVFKVVAARGHVWTATSQSSINRWADVDTSADGIRLPESFRHQRAASATSNRTRQTSRSQHGGYSKGKEVSPESILRLSNTAVFPLRTAMEPESSPLNEFPTRRGSHAIIEPPDPDVKPIHELPQETIEGQFGLLKHKMLNDRRRVLTLDTAGDVLMWDLIKCKPIQSFGKQHLEDVEKQVNTREAVAPWCSVDLSSGNLTVILESFNCFDAEVYADELRLDEPIDFREDQRINLGRWILRYLFANLIDEEIRRDASYRKSLDADTERRQAANRTNTPTSIDLSLPRLSDWQDSDQVTTPRANGLHLAVPAPGLGIGLATPAPARNLSGVPENAVSQPLELSTSGSKDDYFAGDKAAKMPATEPSEPLASTDNGDDKGKEKDKDKAGDSGKSPGTAFGRKFRMSFGSKKLGRSSSQAAQDKPVIVEDKAVESESSSTHEKEVDDSFLGVVQKIRNEYDRQLVEATETDLMSGVTPSLPAETPVLKLPRGTKIMIQEETSGGNANLYQGTVENVGKDADAIERKAPMWLGEVLLQNHIPHKDLVKISFVLYPMGDLPPVSPSDSNNRLNANRMLRVKKVLSYIVERIEDLSEEPKPAKLAPEEYLELYCNEQLLPPSMSLATVRTHVWKGGNDIVLHYKANGRKVIKPLAQPLRSPEAQQAEGDVGAGAGATAGEAHNTSAAS
ncbi:hypothetical protein RJ55_02435 [Drechmeria coniospora]|nr:hypothetical protein RJ55_02435 [Drechmeria coniospora]